MDDIKFRLDLDKEKYLLGEPIIASLDISNVGKKRIPVVNLLDPKFDIVKFYIKRQDMEVLFIPYLLADSVSATRVLRPNESLKGDVKIFYGARDWTFTSPGKYQISAIFNGLADDRKVRIKSNSIELEILAPRTKQEREQIHLILGDEQGLFLLFEGGDHLSNGIRKLRDLTNKYPDAELSGYANFALGMSYSRDFRSFSTARVRPYHF